MLLPISLFFLDFIIHALCYEWYLYSLLAYFITLLFSNSERYLCKYVALFLLLIQDTFLYGRFGLSLAYLVPLLCCVKFIRIVFNERFAVVLNYVLLIFIFLFDAIIIKKWLFMRYVAVQSTIFKIIVNIIVMNLILFGTQGSRFLFFLGIKRGKSGLQAGRMPYEVGYIRNRFK